jgi:hypothetical protein
MVDLPKTTTTIGKQDDSDVETPTKKKHQKLFVRLPDKQQRSLKGAIEMMIVMKKNYYEIIG